MFITEVKQIKDGNLFLYLRTFHAPRYLLRTLLTVITKAMIRNLQTESCSSFNPNALDGAHRRRKHRKFVIVQMLSHCSCSFPQNASLSSEETFWNLKKVTRSTVPLIELIQVRAEPLLLYLFLYASWGGGICSWWSLLALREQSRLGIKVVRES